MGRVYGQSSGSKSGACPGTLGRASQDKAHRLRRDLERRNTASHTPNFSRGVGGGVTWALSCFAPTGASSGTPQTVSFMLCAVQKMARLTLRCVRKQLGSSGIWGHLTGCHRTTEDPCLICPVYLYVLAGGEIYSPVADNNPRANLFPILPLKGLLPVNSAGTLEIGFAFVIRLSWVQF